jgi:hypothetical protein
MLMFTVMQYPKDFVVICGVLDDGWVVATKVGER